MEKYEITAMVQLAAETFGGAFATRDEGEHDRLLELAYALASTMSVEEVATATYLSGQYSTSDDLPFWNEFHGQRARREI